MYMHVYVHVYIGKPMCTCTWAHLFFVKIITKRMKNLFCTLILYICFSEHIVSTDLRS